MRLLALGADENSSPLYGLCMGMDDPRVVPKCSCTASFGVVLADVALVWELRRDPDVDHTVPAMRSSGSSRRERSDAVARAALPHMRSRPVSNRVHSSS